MSETNDYCGVVRTYYDNEETKLFEEYFINAGKIEGIYNSYYQHGQLREKVNYVDGKMNGIYKEYYYNGQLAGEVNYIFGKMNGIYKSYHLNGKLESEVNYVNGKKKGFINHIMKIYIWFMS